MVDREKVITGLECCSVKQSCLECPWMGLDCNDRLHLAALELLKEQPAKDTNVPSKWICVEDRLPEEHESMFYKLLGTPKWSNSMWKQESEKVLVYVSFPDGTGVVTTGCLHNSDWVTTVSKTLPQTVTHWMPLPEPPEEVKHDE